MPNPDQSVVIRTPAVLRRRHRLVALVTVAVLTVLAASTSAPPRASAAAPASPVTTWGYRLSSPVPASLTATGAVAIAAGDDHGLALTPRGQVVGWGSDEFGESTTPSTLAGKTVTAIAAAGHHSLALTSDGKVTAWGENDFGQTDVPRSLSGTKVTAIAAGHLHNLALTSDGKITAWGYDAEGATRVPASLTGKRVTAISAGGQDNLALTSDGRITAWGWNSYGQTDVPASLSGKKVTAVSAGLFYSLALTSDGKVTGWGDNEYGQARVPASLSGKTTTAISAGTFHSLALTSDGKVTAWGNDDYAQSKVPASLSGTRVTAVAAGYLSSLALTRPAAPPSCVPTTPERELAVSTAQRDGDGLVRSPKVSTAGGLLVAFVSVNGSAPGTQSVTRVSGGGLSWTRVQRDGATSASYEIWQAYASTKLKSTRITAQLADRGHHVTLTVAGFSGARPGVGNASHRSGSRSAPRVSLTPQASGSVVWAVGGVTGSRYDPKPVSGQKIVDDKTFSSPRTGHWTQRVTAASTAGTAVTVADKATAKVWGYAAVEIRGTC